MKHLLLAGLILLSFFAKADTTDVYAPAIIDKPGNYRLHLGGNGLTAAYQVYGSASNVTLTGECESVDDQAAVFIYDYVRVIATRLKITYRSTGKIVQPGKALNWNKPRGGSVTHCEFINNAGLIIQQSDEYVRDTVTIAYNTGSGITKVMPDGNIGEQHCHFLHVVGLKKYPFISMYGNRYIGKPGEADEDIINVSNTDNMDVHHNLIAGAYIYPITSTQGYSGSGFTIEEESTNIKFHNNVVLDCMNALWNISIKSANNNNNWIFNNYGVSAGMPMAAPNLRPYAYWAGWSAYLVNAGIDTSGMNNRVFDNWEAYVTNRNLSHYYTVPGRHDENNVTDNSKPNGTRVTTQNIIRAGLNYSLPYTPTIATMDSAIKRWDDSLARVGSWVGIKKPAGQAPQPEILLSDSVIKLGVLVTGVFTPMDTEGNEAVVSSVSYKSSATAICAVTRDSTNMLQFKLNPIKTGSFILTVTFVNAASETYSKDFPLTVILGQPRATTGTIKIKQ